MLVTSLATIATISTYFVIAYFLAMDTFTTASEAIDSLQVIFNKGACLDASLNFLREE
jgi:hypothetical protein